MTPSPRAHESSLTSKGGSRWGKEKVEEDSE